MERSQFEGGGALGSLRHSYKHCMHGPRRLGWAWGGENVQGSLCMTSQVR